MRVKNSTVRGVLLLGAVAIVSVIAIQTWLVWSTWNIKEKEFDDKVRIALLNVAREFERMGSPLPTYDLINRVSANYYVVNVNDVINANNLEYFLRRELEAVGLNEDFEYGIYDCATNKMVYGNYISYQPGVDSTLIRRDHLPVYDKFTYYFGVHFPRRTSYILGNMKLTTIFSSILLLTVLFFAYAMFIILRQKRLSEMQKDFINNMTHEFKTPISTIGISADVFLQSPEVQQQPRLFQYAHIIKEQSQRLNSQVEKVLQLARLERDNFRINKEPIELHELLEHILPALRTKVEDMGGTLECRLDAAHHCVEADRVHLTNILHNLLDNAVKYCRDVPRIEVRTRNEGALLCLSIRDEGIGIDKAHQQRIFEKFYRVPTGNVHNVKGFGLGLYYVRSICEAHGWKIRLDSAPGRGTTVTIRMKTCTP